MRYNTISPLGALSVSALYDLYRARLESRPHKARSGRRATGLIYEQEIANELFRRRPANSAERKKIEYCLASLRKAEQEIIILLPAGPEQSEVVLPSEAATFTPAELNQLITRYSEREDRAGRALLLEYTDLALDRLETDMHPESNLALAATLLELGRSRQLRMPRWLPNYLSEAIETARTNPAIDETELAVPLLTLHLHTGLSEHEEAAAAIIMRAAQRCRQGHGTAADHALVSLCPEYTEYFHQSYDR